ncbi:MAG: EpsI family protein [Aquabacterium sp.]|uniref:exosortase-associated protein EpsI, B-type n=1 Tax=Aquabacterium sp. TaxID=1872578 RepID=UPI00271B3801|nr:exosortase-associated protein EpsI, B-type [Aquabacterium sp.]MDO9002626.1 EpsI family protein [Aquabacterium sp.]
MTTQAGVSRRVPLAVLLAAGLMLAGAAASVWLKPTKMIADEKPAIVLSAVVPETFGGWKIDPNIVPVLPDPTVQDQLNSLYSETLNRTYVNQQGQRIMLSIAYGRNQNSESTAAHRPEFCYVAQGFTIKGFGKEAVALPTHALSVVRLEAQADRRIEPITYWVTLNEEASTPGLDRKLQQLRYGLQGYIVDGMLMRISSLTDAAASPGGKPDYHLHDQFIADMEKAMTSGFRPRFFGS